MSHSFTPPFSRLPESLPMFPLPGAVVMPGCQLPLNIFEPRYLNMVFDALGADRMIGMVQPDPSASEEDAAVCRTGTAGRITSFSETQDGRLIIVLTGICRFDVGEELAVTRGYRRVMARWGRFSVDYEADEGECEERHRLYPLLRTYFSRKSMEVDDLLLEKMPTTSLVNLMIGQLPFEMAERQALVEAVSVAERLDHLAQLLEFKLAEPQAQGSVRRH
ncbi:LON peptidase substrate-binding domain-containing protein [Methylococcus mesophilus]|uniref:LON peptidase substrate-binding domain-containing protein n=1 Tax=Methylococcus mesophilus TaxID=2993564 RepID=UPI00224A78BD|nr:LON peptidase substrate-binding domain-containing protein [Methylococcus mesophilus]UZR30238.1 LON peptidase substrate-binding domain-containing protein [Methylococcus mesophilus]